MKQRRRIALQTRLPCRPAVFIAYFALVLRVYEAYGKCPPASESVPDWRQSQSLLKTLYDDSGARYVGFAAANHESVAALHELDQFLRSVASTDPAFRYLLMEGPGETQTATIAASKGEFPVDRLKDHIAADYHSLFGSHPQVSYYSKLLETLQDINRNRSENPIVLVCVDALDSARMRQTQAAVRQQKPYSWASSINRERDTARNVLALVSKDREAKGAIFYHAGHLLKNLKRLGVELDEEANMKTRVFTHANWVGFAGEDDPRFPLG